ncbi:MAG: aminotransferase class IV [Chitinophagales bacterium]
MQYINYNGHIFNEQEPLFPAGNRSFRYGDAFFESMVMFNKKIPLLEFHWSRIMFTAEVMSATLPDRMDAGYLENQVWDLASVNEGVSNARIRVQFFRKGGGLYLPEENGLGFVISMDKIPNSRFETGEGLKIGMREDIYKTVSMISDLKSSNALTYVIAAQFAQAEGWDECIFLSDDEHICEAIHSNVFLVKDDKLITPTLDSGCVNGVMRSFIMALMEGQIEERDVKAAELLEADEILLVNAVRGVQWVKQYADRVYSNKKAVEITALLNKSLLETA